MPLHGICFTHAECTPEILLRCRGAIGQAGIEYICWGGAQPLHGYLQATQGVRSMLMAVIGACPMESQRGGSEQAVDRCREGPAFVELGTRARIDAPRNSRGSKADLEGVLDLINQGKTYEEILDAHCFFTARNGAFVRRRILEQKSMEAEIHMIQRYEGVVWRPWQQAILDLVEPEQADGMIHWFWAPVGDVGKTWIAQYLSLTMGALSIRGGDSKAAMTRRWTRHPSKIVVLDICWACHGRKDMRAMAAFCAGLASPRASSRTPSLMVVLAHTEPDPALWGQDRVAVTRVSA